MGERVWTCLKWANLAALVALVLFGADAWVTRRCSGLMSQALSSYHAQYIVPLTKATAK